MKGRDPAWNVFAELDGRVWTELIAVTSLDRAVLPISIRKRVPFLADASAVQLLAILDAGGFARLAPIVGEGDEIIAEARSGILGQGASTRCEMILAAMTRYVRVAVEPTGRFALPTGLAGHLDAIASATLRVVAQNDELYLWSERAWLSRQDAWSGMLPDRATAKVS